MPSSSPNFHDHLASRLMVTIFSSRVHCRKIRFISRHSSTHRPHIKRTASVSVATAHFAPSGSANFRKPSGAFSRRLHVPSGRNCEARHRIGCRGYSCTPDTAAREQFFPTYHWSAPGIRDSSKHLIVRIGCCTRINARRQSRKKLMPRASRIKHVRVDDAVMQNAGIMLGKNIPARPYRRNWYTSSISGRFH